MTLRVPKPQMLDIIPAGRIRHVEARVTLRACAKQLLPLPAPVQLVSMLHDMSGLVTQNGHARIPRAAFDIENHLFFKPHQPRMGEEERKGDARRILGTEPLARNPGMRTNRKIA